MTIVEHISLGRRPDHPDIDEALIERLVNAFYARVRRDPRLGPIFEQNLSADWPTHLGRMCRFWSSVILKTGRYKGRPVPAHLRLEMLGRSISCTGWSSSARPPMRSAHRTLRPASSCAERIAKSLQLNIFIGRTASSRGQCGAAAGCPGAR